MSMKEPRSSRVAPEWSVVFQSIPSRHKNEVVKRMEEILGLDKREAKAILTNAPLVFLDNLAFELAVRIKTYFQKLGVVVEVTNHDIIKKNCSHVSWPKAPDLSFFAGDETGPAQNENEKKESVRTLLTQGKSGDAEMTPETQKICVTPLPEELPPSDIDAELELRAQEMGERFRMLHEEKLALQIRHAEAIDAVKNEFHQKLDAEKKKNEEISRTCEDLRKEVRKFEASSLDSEALRSRIANLDEKVRELDEALKEKATAVELLTQQKEELTRRMEKTEADTQLEITTLRNREPEFLGKIGGLEQTVQQLTTSLKARDSALAQSENRRLEVEASLREKTSAAEILTRQKEEFIRQTEKTVAETHRELAALRNREPELLRTIDGLERSVHQMSETLHARDNELARSGKQLSELEAILKEKTSNIEILIRQNEELNRQSGKVAAEAQQELAAVRNRELELLKKIAGLEKTVQQMTASLRARDSALAQFEEQVTKLIEMSAFPLKKAS